jgi:hypothetical protein
MHLIASTNGSNTDDGQKKQIRSANFYLEYVFETGHRKNKTQIFCYK